MVGPNDEMPPWLTPVDQIDDAAPASIFAGNMKKLVITVAVIVIAIFSVAMWLMYDRQADDFSQPIEVVAESGPVKVRPQDSGGKEILDQDKGVFKRITGEAEDRQDTALGEEAEMPLSELPADEIKQDIKVVEEAIDIEEKSVVTEPATKSIVRKKPVVAKPAPAPAAKATISADKHRIQLGAYGEKSGASAFWKEISAKMPNVFAGMREEFVPLTRNGRTLYRLRAGPVENRAAADRLCLQLKAKQYACMVVDPK